jgi:hypothetical protein
MTPSTQELREALVTLLDKRDVSSSLASFLRRLLDRIEALEQQGRSAIRPGFFPQPKAAEPAQPQPLCPICLTRQAWGIGEKE